MSNNERTFLTFLYINLLQTKIKSMILIYLYLFEITLQIFFLGKHQITEEYSIFLRDDIKLLTSKC